MITVFVSENNPISQKSYDDDQLDPFRLSCTCGCSGSLIRYGSYRHHVKADGAKLPLIIRRVLCQSRSRSHTLIPSSLIPYSQIPLEDQVSLIEAFEQGNAPDAVLDSNPEMDERTPFRLIRMYLIYWRERLLSERIALHPFVRLTK